jgi:integrase
LNVRLAQPGSQPRGVPDNALVLGNRPLRSGVARTATSRFGDTIWRLSPAIFHAHRRELHLNFARVPKQFRLAAKELFYALLAGEPPAGHLQLKVATIHGHFSTVLAFLAWADQRGVASLSALTAEDLAAYQEHLVMRRGMTADRRRKHRHAVRLFWIYRAQLAADQLVLDPDQLEEWDESTQTGRRENRIQRIPEVVMGPLLGWALRWVDDLAEDVLRANHEWMHLHANTGPNRTRRGVAPARDVRPQLQALLARYRSERRPLPSGRKGWVNQAQVARELDCSPAALNAPSLVAMINAAISDVGFAKGTWLRAEIRGRINDQSWRDAIGYAELPQLARQLHTACYIVIAYLSGMRESEVKHLRRGCLATHRDNTGRAYRHTVTSQAFKGERTPKGVKATWVVGEPVRRAVGVLERLQPPDQDLLFAHLPCSPSFRRRQADRTKSSTQTCRDLAAFVDWINAYCDTYGLPDRIPLVCGQRWQLTSRQFRRTLAWFIARRPGGVIAGAIAYRHQSVQLFEGYAGTSASGFRAEVEAEEALERGERLLAMVEGHEHQHLGGPAAQEAEARLEKFGQQAGFAGTVVTDERRLQVIMRRHDPNIYLGRFVTCIHNRDRALCRRPDDDGQGPVLPQCKPLACRNVALTPANLAAWREHLTQLDQALAFADVLAPYLRHRLTEQRDQIAQFLDQTGHSLDSA